jgi:hypothetical protein
MTLDEMRVKGRLNLLWLMGFDSHEGGKQGKRRNGPPGPGQRVTRKEEPMYLLLLP